MELAEQNKLMNEKSQSQTLLIKNLKFFVDSDTRKDSARMLCEQLSELKE